MNGGNVHDNYFPVQLGLSCGRRGMIRMRARSVAILLTATLGCAVSQPGVLVEYRETVTLNSRYAPARSNLGFTFF
jgi:hypothetical protein